MGKGDLYLDTERMLETEHGMSRRRNSQPLWLKMKIFATLCCCTICGVASMAYTVTSQRSLALGDEYGSQRKHRKARCCLLTSIILGVLFMVGLAILDYYTFNIMFSTLNKLCKMQQICTTGDGVVAVAEDPNVTCSHIYACAFPVPDWIANN